MVAVVVVLVEVVMVAADSRRVRGTLVLLGSSRSSMRRSRMRVKRWRIYSWSASLNLAVTGAGSAPRRPEMAIATTVPTGVYVNCSR